VGPSCLIVEPGTSSQAQIIGDIQEGLFVREVSGLHSGVNPVSGDLSVGVEGTLIRDGELTEPVKEVTIGSTVQRMLADVVAVGDDLRRFPWESAGVTLAIADVMMSGN
jgi:PmbA protein